MRFSSTPYPYRYSLITGHIRSIASIVLFVLILRVIAFTLPLLVALSMGHSMGNPWAHWDAVYYVRLATVGYAPYVHGSDHTGLAFLPLYPLLVSLPVHFGLSSYGAAVALSNLCSFLACVALGLLVTRDFGADVAIRTLILIVAAPAALFLNVGYSESLYLACSLWGFALLRRRHWTRAALLFTMAAATRPMGIVLVLSYAAEWRLCYGRTPCMGLNRLAPLLLPLLSLALVAAYDASIGASPFAYLQVEHTAWHQSWAWPWVTIARHIAVLVALRDAGSSLLPTALLNLVAVAVAVPLLIVTACRLPRSYSLYALGVFALTIGVAWDTPFYGQDVMHPFIMPLMATHRYLLLAFPIAISVALLLRQRTILFTGVVAVAAFLQLAFTILFMHGVWAG